MRRRKDGSVKASAAVAQSSAARPCPPHCPAACRQLPLLLPPSPHRPQRRPSSDRQKRRSPLSSLPFSDDQTSCNLQPKAHPLSAHPSALSDASCMPLCAAPAAEMLWQRKARRVLPPPPAAGCSGGEGAVRVASDVSCEATASAAACRANGRCTGHKIRLATQRAGHTLFWPQTLPSRVAT
jgi:hypothetical protein